MADINQLNRQLMQQLAAFAFAPVRRTSDADIALQILKNSNVDFSNVWSMNRAVPTADNKKRKGGPSTISRIIDILSRPLYGTANVAKSEIADIAKGDPTALLGLSGLGALTHLPEFWQGFSGKEKTTTRDIMAEVEKQGVNIPDVIDKGVGGFAVGLAGDVLLDPTTYVGAGAVKGLARGAYKLAGKDAPKWAQAVKAAPQPPIADDLAQIKTPIVGKGETPSAFKVKDKVVNPEFPLSKYAASQSKLTPQEKKLAYEGWAKYTDDQLLEFGIDPMVMRQNIAKAGIKKVAPDNNVVRSRKEIDEALGKLRKEESKPPKFKHPPPSSLPAALAKALDDAPAVSTALEETTKRDAIADAVLHSDQQKALAADKHLQDGRQVLKAAGVSIPAQKTYTDIMQSVTRKERSGPQQAIDRHADDLAISISSKPSQNRFRGPKGQFQAYGTKVPTYEKTPTRSVSPRRQSVPGKIYTARKVELSAKGAADDIARALAQPRPSRPIKNKKSFVPQGAPQLTGAKVGEKAASAKPKPYLTRRDIQRARAVSSSRTSLTRALNQELDEPIRLIKPGETVGEKTVKDGIMSRIATWWGQRDIRPQMLDAITGARAAANARIEALDKAFKGYTSDEILEAWNYARYARPRELADERIGQLADVISGNLEQWFRSRAIPEHVARGNSVAMRSGMVMEDLNRMLRRYGIDFQFTNKVVKDPVTHGQRSYANGTDWLYSWETKEFTSGDEVKKFIFGVQTAAEQLSREYAVLDDIAERFGKTKPEKGYTTQVKHERLKGVYFNSEVADQISTALKVANEVYSPKSGITKFLAKGTSMWKSGVTKYHPRHHIMNLIGDAFLMWIAGVNDPRVFAKAAKVLHANKGLYRDLASIDDLVGADAVKNAMAKPGSVVTKNKSGHKFTAEQIYVAAFNYGLLQKANVLEDIVSPGGPLGFKPFGGKVSQAANTLSEVRDHYIRLAHFIDAVSKSRGGNYAQIFQDAAHKVRKWHPDGMDLTKTEQALRTNLIPFYSWTRKAIPLLIEGAVMRPQKTVLAPAKFQYNLQTALGINPASPSDPFPMDQMFPEWIQEEGIGPLGRVGMPGLAGFIGGLGRQDPEQKNAYTVMGVPTPFQEMFGSFGGFDAEGIRSGIMGLLNPAVKIPIELGVTKQVSLTGQPLYGSNSKSKADYITEQIPLVNQFARMTNIGPFGYTSRGEKEGFGNRESFLNWLTNAGIIGTGPYIKSAEFEDIPRQKKQNEKYRAFAEQLGFPLKKNSKIPDWIKQLYAQQYGGE